VGHGVRSVGLEEGLRAGQIMVAHAEECIYAYFHNTADRQMIPAAVRTTKETAGGRIDRQATAERPRLVECLQEEVSACEHPALSQCSLSSLWP
jgi:hypothetical protein